MIPLTASGYGELADGCPALACQRYLICFFLTVAIFRPIRDVRLEIDMPTIYEVVGGHPRNSVRQIHSCGMTTTRPR
jgi:hypothetical protein